MGVAPDGEPVAELWIGAHPAAPADALVDGQWVSLLELVANRPSAMLGPNVIGRFGDRLPFLLKVLAAEHPLSLQVHPSLAQAREGYAREEAAGVPRLGVQRSYKDRNHKPELICALTTFEALSGFRSPSESAATFVDLDVAGLAPFAAQLRAGNLREVFWGLWDLDPAEQAVLVARVSQAAAAKPNIVGSYIPRLAAQYPGDIGVVVALLLNHVTLAPGEALFAPAGRLHSYLSGVGVEVMANSDNVVRGGLTSKFVDRSELERLTLLEVEDIAPLLGQPSDCGLSYNSSVADFSLSTVSVAGGPLRATVRGPELLLCTEGSVTVDGLSLVRGQAAFVAAAQGSYLIEGTGVLYRTQVGA